MKLKEVRALFLKPVKEVNKKTVAEVKVDQLRLDVVLQKIKEGSETTPKELIVKSGFSPSCVRNSLICLFNQNKITRKYIAKAGANKIYSYSAVKGVE